MSKCSGLRLLMFVGVVVGLSASIGQAEITRYPYLQPTIPSGSTVGIAWRTANKAGGTIHYGINDVNEHSVQDPAEATRHFVVLRGLKPGTVYKYRVVSDGTTTPIYAFKTSPPDGRFKALLLSDVHVHEPGEKNYEQWLQRWWRCQYPRMLQYDPDLVLICGDLTQTGKPGQWDELFRRAQELFATAIVLPVQGNHDKGDEVYRDQFYLPENGPERIKEVNYSYDYGGCHFLMIWRMDDATPKWIAKDLAPARKATFIFGMRHYPVYVDTKWDYENVLDRHKQALIDLFDHYGMDVWFQGHRHTIQRTLPIVKNPLHPQSWGLIYTPQVTGYNARMRGTIYMQIRSGWYAKTGGLGINPYFAYEDTGRTSYIGYSTMDVAGPRCTIRSYRCDHRGKRWKLEDEFSIDKADQSDLPAPRFVEGPVARNISAYRAEIVCRTDRPARLIVEYGTQAGEYIYSTPPVDVAQHFATDHSIWLQALQPNTKYYFRARACLQDKATTSSEGSFVTAAPAAGQIVAKFNFQPKQYVPPGDYAPACEELYSPAARCGWIDRRAVSERSLNEKVGFEVNSFCAADNRKPAKHWQADVPNGVYEVEIVSGNAGWFYGDTRIVLENGQAVLTAAAPEDKASYKTWKRRVIVRDGKLNLDLGIHDSARKKFTVVNSLILRTVSQADPSAGAHP